MYESYRLLIAIGILIIGFFLGNFLAKATKEELKGGKKWFKILIVFSAIGAIISLILRKDCVLFTFLLIIVVTSCSLKK